MADLQFNEGQDIYSSRALPQPSFLTGLVLKTGLAQTEQGAQRILLGIAIICAVAALYVAFSGGGTERPPSPLELEQAGVQTSY